jgi:hypothetical protein
MGQYYYPTALNRTHAMKMHYKRHGHDAPHCFKNLWGDGYVLFDTKADVNAWYKEHSGQVFYKEEYEPGTIFTKDDAYKEIEQTYGYALDSFFSSRDMTMPILALGLPASYGDLIFMRFTTSDDENDIAYRFYLHYTPVIFDVNANTSNTYLRNEIVKIIYKHFYTSRFKSRIEGSKAELARRAEAELQQEAERQKRVKEMQRKAEQEQKYHDAFKLYLSQKDQYDLDLKNYNEIMRLRKKFSYGGQCPQCPVFVCTILWFIYMPFSFCSLVFTKDLPNIIYLAIDILLLYGGYYLIFKKIKPYIETTHFNQKAFNRWVQENPNSPLISKIKAEFPPNKPIPPKLPSATSYY